MSKSKKRKVRDMIRMRSYFIVSRAVDEGVAMGWEQAHGYGYEPTADAIKSRIEDEVMNAICNVVDFDDE